MRTGAAAAEATANGAVVDVESTNAAGAGGHNISVGIIGVEC
jgi:hypothetical protein